MPDASQSSMADLFFQGEVGIRDSSVTGVQTCALPIYGFDLEFSLQVREAGRKLMVADLRVVHHRALELIGDLAVWVEAHIRLAEKWNGTLRDPVSDEPGWKRRARRAEAQREAARAVAMSESLKLDA